MRAVDIARTHFDRFSFDLIYARPGQSVEAWRSELREALARAGNHLSLYQLTIEPDTWFAKLHAAGKLVTPDADLARDLWDVTQEECDRAGMPAYEISNHARPGSESRHNLVYWRYGEYAAIGPGAHGRLLTDQGRVAFSNERQPERWLENVERLGHGAAEENVLTRGEQGDEFLVMGLRLREGIDVVRYEEISGRQIDGTRIDDLIGYGFIKRVGNRRIAVTATGFPILNAVVADLAA
jgi:coproporphyrinogen III oxidase-like Fe-S oxidoreductase